jgi:hypothetical protein
MTMSGEIQKDDDGYITVVLGVYDKHISKEVFEDFKNRCLKGVVYCETVGPRRQPHMSDDDYLQRFSEIHPENACAHIRDVTLSEDSTRMIGQIRAAGPYADLFKHALGDEPEVSFGIRGFYDTRDTKQLKPLNVVTYDMVAKP